MERGTRSERPGKGQKVAAGSRGSLGLPASHQSVVPRVPRALASAMTSPGQLGRPGAMTLHALHWHWHWQWSGVQGTTRRFRAGHYQSIIPRLALPVPVLLPLAPKLGPAPAPAPACKSRLTTPVVCRVLSLVDLEYSRSVRRRFIPRVARNCSHRPRRAAVRSHSHPFTPTLSSRRQRSSDDPAARQPKPPASQRPTNQTPATTTKAIEHTHVRLTGFSLRSHLDSSSVVATGSHVPDIQQWMFAILEDASSQS